LSPQPSRATQAPDRRGTRDAQDCLRMLRKDRALLRNLVIATVLGTGAAVVIGTSCLGRNPQRSATSNQNEATAREDWSSERTSAGGAPPASMTEITSGELERGASATGVPSEAPPETPIAPVTTAPPAPTSAPDAAPPPESLSSEAMDASAPEPTSTAAVPDAAPPPRVEWTDIFRTPTYGLEAGAGQFLTEPPPLGASSMATTPNPQAGAGEFLTQPAGWAASAFTPDPQAGAGRFVTEQRSPPTP